MTSWPVTGLGLWFFAAALLAVIVGIPARRGFRFSLASLLSALLVTGAAMLSITALLVEEPAGLRGTALVGLGVGALLWTVAGLLAAAYLRARLMLPPRRADVLAWVAGMTLAWSLALMAFVTVVK